MTDSQWAGMLIVAAAGLCLGLAPWPVKAMRRFRYEHWGFVSMLAGLVLLPWVVMLSASSSVPQALQAVGARVLFKANLFSLGWGIANILFLKCLVRIGVSLAGGIIGGLAVAGGTVVPLVFKGTGAFHNAPSALSPPGAIILGGVAVLLLGVLLATLAGMARESRLKTSSRTRRGFSLGLAMAITAGILGCGSSLAFVYSQGPIVEALRARGAGDVSANISVWATALFGGALANVIYPAYLMTRNRSWSVLRESPREIGLALLLGIAYITGFSLLGRGMLLLGALGASVGFGVQQCVQMLGNQALGFASGEWRSVPSVRMYVAVALLLAAIIILSVGNSLSRA
jgi:hypothetical protein